MVFSDQHKNMKTRLKQLHNFDLPRLKWGNQKLLKCIKLPHSHDDVAIIPDCNNRSSPSKKLKSIKHDNNEIEATREKLMSDFRKEVGKMKHAIFIKTFPAMSPAVVPATAAEDRLWNLRTRRAACKATPVAGEANGNERERELCFPAKFRRPAIGEKRERFSVSLSRRDVEDDFMVMTGRRLPRKPKKRPRAVQKQLDSLFPGFWLTEVTPDLYKVPDEVETGKR